MGLKFISRFFLFINLLLAVSNEKVFHFKIYKENTSSSVFKVFMDELLQKVSNEERESHIIILDNFF